MTTANWQHVRLVTVATEDFVPGACVMFASFLRTHPNFQGELVTVTDDLSADAMASLHTVSPRIKILKAGSDLLGRIATLTEAIPALSETSGRFLSLEAIRPAGFERVLYCDSDILFLRPIDSMLENDQDVTAAGDGCFLRGGARNLDTLAEVAPGPGLLNQTFNAGMMIFGPNALTGNDFSTALAELSEQRFGKLECGLHDQAIYNLVFADRVKRIGWSFNYLLKHRALIQSKEPIPPREIRVLHFNQRIKPWNLTIDQIEEFADPFRKWATLQWLTTAQY